MKQRITIILILALVAPLASQSQPSIQGVWRVVARTIPASTNPGDRKDPFGHVPEGTQTAVQPGLLIFTQKHYSRTTDTAVQPRPTSSEVVPRKADGGGAPGALGSVPGQCGNVRAYLETS